jgi:uncharacterized membrane protein YdjX (TVP38/TMEM64 family)
MSRSPKNLKSTLARLALGVLLVAGIVYSVRYLEIPDCGTIQAKVDAFGPWAPLAFLGIYVVATVVFIPGVVVTMFAGLAFGPWWGTLLVTVGATLGAVLAFLIARYMAHDLVERFLSRYDWFATFKESCEREGFNYVVFARLVPIFPFNALNYASGLVPLSLKDYTLGSFVGMIPGTFAYVYLGVAGCSLIDPMIDGKLSLASLPGETTHKLVIAFALLAALAVLPIFLRKRRSA